MPPEYEQQGYCLDKAVWIVEHSPLPAEIEIGYTGKTGTTHAEAIIKDSYRGHNVGWALDGSNTIYEHLTVISVEEAKEIIKNGRKISYKRLRQ